MNALVFDAIGIAFYSYSKYCKEEEKLGKKSLSFLKFIFQK